jgi:bifunctional UDP-N-acetylglucosamine pyrophosphorylase/glucosamine-1-phosphate N-acetyltransferase
MEQFDWDEGRRRLAEGGVLMMDPGTVYVEPTVSVGAGTLLLPGTILRGNTAVGADCEIGPNTMIVNCIVGDGTVINSSQCNNSTIGSHTKIGPFAYIRPNCTIGDEVKLGDFVETKNSVIGDGTKISHLTYVGDADVGTDVNMGCGTVTVNYDGAHKFRTKVGNNVFVGCNTNLVAPVAVGDGAYIAAGSTITDEVPSETLAIARARQVVKSNWTKPKK